MSTVTQLVEAPPATAPFDIVRAALIELHVPDLDAAERFYADLLGMIVAAREDDAVYLRAWEEHQHHSLVLRRGETAAVARIGFRVWSDEDLDRAERHLAERGLTVRSERDTAPGISRTVTWWDPLGYPITLFAEMERVEPQTQRFDLHRGAPLLRFDHFNFHTPRPEEAFAFWQSLGFRCSEYISTDGDDERLTGAWMMRKPNVHDVAFTLGRGPRLHHFAFWIGEPAGVLRACDQLAAAGHVHAIERGPGRHGVSNAFFVYLRDPAGHRVELYACDYYTGDPDRKPLRWSVRDPRCRSFWGTAAPDSWYEESSPVLGPDGKPQPTAAADLDEREARSQVMA